MDRRGAAYSSLEREWKEARDPIVQGISGRTRGKEAATRGEGAARGGGGEGGEGDGRHEKQAVAATRFRGVEIVSLFSLSLSLFIKTCVTSSKMLSCQDN